MTENVEKLRENCTFSRGKCSSGREKSFCNFPLNTRQQYSPQYEISVFLHLCACVGEPLLVKYIHFELNCTQE